MRKGDVETFFYSISVLLPAYRQVGNTERLAHKSKHGTPNSALLVTLSLRGISAGKRTYQLVCHPLRWLLAQ